MAADGVSFRAVLAQWPSGVVIVTTGLPGGEWHGMTASSFSSVSLDPPMVLVCLAKAARTHRLVQETGTFAVSLLGRDQAALGRRFAGQDPAPGGRFAGARWVAGVTGSPVLADSVGWLDCRVAHAHPGGDHTIFVGEVLAADTPRHVAPALFHSRAWSQLADPLPDEIAVADTGLLAFLRTRGHDAARLAAVSRALRGAGLRVRLAGRYEDLSPARDLDPATASALVTGPGQIGGAARAGAGTVELLLPARRCAPARPGGTAAPGTSAGPGPLAGPGSAAHPGVLTGPGLPADPDAGPWVLDGVAATVRAARQAGLTTVVHLAGAFDERRAGAVVAVVGRLAELGCDEIGLAEDGIAASPLRVRELLGDAAPAAGSAALRVRLRERDGIGLVNALVAMKSGVRRFDTTLGGVDGHLSAEDVLALAAELNVASPADRSALIAGLAGIPGIADIAGIAGITELNVTGSDDGAGGGAMAAGLEPTRGGDTPSGPACPCAG